MKKKLFFLLPLIFSGCTLLTNPVEYKYNKEQVLSDLCNTIKNNYPYLSFKKINVDSLYKIYDVKLSNYDGDKIFDLLYDVLKELKDGHVWLYTLGGFPVQPYTPPRMTKDRHTYDANVVSNYFPGPLTLCGESKMEYGLMSNNIGYVYISTLLRGDGTWYQDFADVISRFMNTNGIIIDVRNNGGGSDMTSFFIVQQLLQTTFLSPIWLDTKGNEFSRVTLYPARSNPYQKSIVILQNGLNFSAAEGLISMLRELPNITTIGDTTGGGSGNPQNFNIADNLSIHISTEAQLTYERQFIEWNGLIPDILVLQTQKDLDNGRDPQLEAAIKYLTKEL